MKSIRSKIMAAILAVTFLSAVAMAVVFYVRSSDMIEDNYITVLQQRVRLLTDTLDEMFREIWYTGVSAACDDDIVDCAETYIGDGDSSELEKMAEMLRVYKDRHSLITSMYLVIPEYCQVVSTLDYPVTRGDLERKSIEEIAALAENGTGLSVTEDILHLGQDILTYIETVENEAGEVLGYICTNIEMSRLFYEYFDGMLDTELLDLVLVADGQIAVSGSEFRSGKPQNTFDDIRAWTGEYDVMGADEGGIYICCEGAFSGCGVFAQAEKALIMGNVLQSRFYALGVTVFVLLMAAFLTFFLGETIYRPIRKITTAIRAVSAGELDTRVRVNSKDEIGLLADEFNRMTGQVQELICRVVREESAKKDAELEALQYQITPHFMYNTLNAIRCSALINGDDETACVIGDFAELLQICIRKKGAFLTVEEEIHILKKYISLQEFRRGEKIEKFFEISDEASMCLVPRLILQPLVENALLHGLDMKQKQGRLVVRASVTGGTLRLEVEDNGRGMSKGKIEELLGRQAGRPKKTRGMMAIGIPNIRERLALYYKEKAELHYESGGAGTTAIICLPAEKEDVL